LNRGEISKVGEIKITEKQFERQVKELAKLFDYKYYHTWRSFHSPQGFPDCVMVKDDRLIFAELKSETGQPTLEQYFWLLALTKANQEVYLWRPSDFENIADVLRDNT
jgi:hypothetical protein